MLAGLAVAMLVAGHWVTDEIAGGAPGWLNLIVFVLLWDAVKIGLVAISVGARVVFTSFRRGAIPPRSVRRIRGMSDDLSLFGDDAPVAPASVAPPASAPISDWQIDLLRKALDARGLTSMSDRQAAIELAAGRTVESLRALTHEEGLRVLSRLGESPAIARSEKSAWDDRDEDTWIDRL